MRISIILLFILFTTSSWSAQCHLYQIKGQITRHKDLVHLVINENTRVEKKLRIPDKELPPVIPYIGQTVSGEFILKTPVTKGDQVLKVSSLKEAIPDPLNQKNHSSIHEVKVVPCP